MTSVAAAHATTPAPTGDLETRASVFTKAVAHNRNVIRFFERHAWLFRDARFAAEAQRERTLHVRNLAETRRKLATVRRQLAAARRQAARQAQTRRLAAVRARSPQEAICDVFGRFCAQALAVARCESRFRLDARNGQYLGLFQMGSSERRLFGHGSDAHSQAQAAHRYFVRSGSDWSPWSCKPW